MTEFYFITWEKRATETSLCLMGGIHKAASSSATSRAMERDGEEGAERWRKTQKSERKERDGVREGRGNLTYFFLTYLYAEDNSMNQPLSLEAGIATVREIPVSKPTGLD